MIGKDLIGSSAKFRALLEQIDLIAPFDCTVLIQGETGTGKEVIARAIHERSPRRQNCFVALNCAAIPSGLLESELFGHERGAFTGAVARTMGRFQSADRGTLFLDEIGDLPFDLQPKLLRVLQEKQFERLGASQTFQVDVRVIAATNQDLRHLVQERAFRADLYYRLNVIPIRIPPLRERAEDIPLLVDHFVRKFSRQQGKSVDRVPDYAMKAMKQYDWPGNIRELQNLIERAVILSDHGVLCDPMPALEENENHSVAVAPVRGTLHDSQRSLVLQTLEVAGWIVGGSTGAAARLGLKRTTLLGLMKRLGITRPVRENDIHVPNHCWDRQQWVRQDAD